MQLVYYFLSIILFFLFFQDKNDFLIFYNAGKIVLNNIDELYNQSNYLWDFRYFPVSALMFTVFSLINFQASFVLFNTLNLVLNFISGYYLYRILSLVKHSDYIGDKEKLYRYTGLFLVGFPHVLNYIYGQINSFVAFFLLVALYLFLSKNSVKWNFLASLILGLSIVIKPTALLLIPFLVVFHYNLKSKQIVFELNKTISRIIGVFVPISTNFVFFILKPSLFTDFLETNFTGNNPVALNFSFSLTKSITNFLFFYSLPFNQMTIFLTILIVTLGLGMVIYIFMINPKQNVLYGFTLGIIIMLLAYFDSWDHHLLSLTPLLLIIMITLPIDSKNLYFYVKPSLYFLNFVNLAFVGFWYLIFPIFPINFETTIVLIILFYVIARICFGYDNAIK